MESLKTLDSNFKGAVFAYLGLGLMWNKQTIKNHTLNFCKERFLLNQRVFYFPKDFYLVDEINHQIAKLSSNGILNFLISQYVDHSYLRVKDHETVPKSLKLMKLSGIFHVYAGMLMLSFIQFLAEIICNRVKLRRNYVA